jgi:hypothetical protein
VVFLFGNKNYGEHLGYIATNCPTCRIDRIFSIDQRRQKFTVYFIPTVQYRVKQYMTCQSCREQFEIADDLKPQIAERLMTEKQLKTVLSEMAGSQNALLPLCQDCAQPVDSGMRFCPNCGSQLK